MEARIARIARIKFTTIGWLAVVLQKREIRDAVIDTWEKEPDINLELLKQVFIGTPHIAGYSADGKANATRMALEGLCNFFKIPFQFNISAPELPEELRPTPDMPLHERALLLYNPQKDSSMLKTHPEQFEELRGTPLGQAAYEDVIARCLYLGDREKALEITEELATSRLWSAAAPTQVRPMNFFENPNLREFLLEPESLRRIREAAFIDDGSLIRK